MSEFLQRSERSLLSFCTEHITSVGQTPSGYCDLASVMGEGAAKRQHLKAVKELGFMCLG